VDGWAIVLDDAGTDHAEIKRQFHVSYSHGSSGTPSFKIYTTNKHNINDGNERRRLKSTLKSERSSEPKDGKQRRHHHAESW